MKFNRSKEDGDNLPRVKLKDGESVYGVLRGDLHEYDTHWVGKGSVDCPGAGCEFCKTEKSRFRFKVNMVVRAETGYVVKILEQGWKTYEQLRLLGDECDLESTLIKIVRSGSTQNDTSYTVLAVPKPLTPDQLKQIGSLPLIELKKPQQSSPMASQKPAMTTPEFTEDDIPF